MRPHTNDITRPHTNGITPLHNHDGAAPPLHNENNRNSGIIRPRNGEVMRPRTGGETMTYNIDDLMKAGATQKEMSDEKITPQKINKLTRSA